MTTREHLPREQIRQILDAATRAGLAQSRSALLAGVDQHFIMSLPHAPSPGAQLLLDLSELNRITALADGAVPLFDWLSNAAALAGPRTEADVFRVALEALKITASVAPPPRDSRRETDQRERDAPPTKRDVKNLIGVLLALGVEEFWADSRASALHKVLKVAYDDVANIKQITAIAGVDTSGVSMVGGVGDIWFDLLSVAIRAAKITKLLTVILEDERIAFYHPQIRRLIS